MNILQDCRKFFYGVEGGLSKNVGHHGRPTTKIKKNWLIRPKEVLKNEILDQNTNDSKSRI